MKLAWVVSGLALLLVSSYLDNIRALFLPLLPQVFNLTYSQMSWYMVAGNLAAVVCTSSLIAIHKRYSTRAVTLGICVLVLVTAASARYVNQFPSLMLLALFQGTAISMAGAMSNFWVFEGTLPSQRSQFLCGLHMMYGIGSLVAPELGSALLVRGAQWFQLLEVLLPAVVVLALFIWIRIPPGKTQEVAEEAGNSAFQPIHYLVIALFGAYVAAEVMVSAWMVTFLVDAKGMQISEASKFLSGFFMMMALSRGVCFLGLKPQREKWVLGLALGLATVFFVLGHLGWTLGFALSGVLGPCFPLILSRTSQKFPKHTRKLTLSILAMGQLSMAIGHRITGYLTDRFGVEKSYYLPLVLLILAIGLLFFYFDRENRVSPAKA